MHAQTEDRCWPGAIGWPMSSECVTALNAVVQIARGIDEERVQQGELIDSLVSDAL